MRRLWIVTLLIWPLAIPADEGNAGSRLSELLDDDAEGFAKALSAREFSFPRDHGPHPEFRNEWWYITGNLDGDAGRRFGFEFTVFRFSLTPVPPEQDSAWRTNQVYIAHLALTDPDNNRFYVAERFSRGALGLAGAQSEPFRVWIDDWQMSSSESGQSWRVRASGDEFMLDLSLTPMKEPVLNGERGLSWKSSSTDSASYYYSITRLGTEGSVSVDGRDYPVSGLSWLDREWSTSALAPDQAGWDWFSLQLSDGTDLMLYNIRKTDGTADENSSGTFTFAGGGSRGLKQGDFDIVVDESWESPEGGVYPSRWTVRIPEQELEIEIAPVIADQELFTTVRYWEGAVDVSGTNRGNAVSGRGYVELTGYAD